jgi:hypothetical protein
MLQRWLTGYPWLFVFSYESLGETWSVQNSIVLVKPVTLTSALGVYFLAAVFGSWCLQSEYTNMYLTIPFEDDKSVDHM